MRLEQRTMCLGVVLSAMLDALCSMFLARPKRLQFSIKGKGPKGLRPAEVRRPLKNRLRSQPLAFRPFEPFRPCGSIDTCGSYSTCITFLNL